MCPTCCMSRAPERYIGLNYTWDQWTICHISRFNFGWSRSWPQHRIIYVSFYYSLHLHDSGGPARLIKLERSAKKHLNKIDGLFGYNRKRLAPFLALTEWVVSLIEARPFHWSRIKHFVASAWRCCHRSRAKERLMLYDMISTHIEAGCLEVRV